MPSGTYIVARCYDRALECNNRTLSKGLVSLCRHVFESPLRPEQGIGRTALEHVLRSTASLSPCLCLAGGRQRTNAVDHVGVVTTFGRPQIRTLLLSGP